MAPQDRQHIGTGNTGFSHASPGSPAYFTIHAERSLQPLAFGSKPQIPEHGRMGLSTVYLHGREGKRSECALGTRA
jgi:hypothetical protein